MNDFPLRIGHGEAEALLFDLGQQLRLPKVSLALRDSLGRVLAEDVIAPIDLPPFDNSAMDGFAYRHADYSEATREGICRLRLIGEQFAGRDCGFLLGQGECLRITTGAPLPSGADSVAIKEDCRLLQDGDGVFWIELPAGLKQGTHRRPAGEDVSAGQTVLSAGSVINASRLGVIAALGLPRVNVSALPRITVFSSGDELVATGDVLRPGEIHDSNGPMLAALLAEQGLAALQTQRLPDDPALIRERLVQAASSSDLIITCGGVSAGEKDHITSIVADLGEVLFWKVRIKPGMPLLCARIGDCAMLGLPGNPVSVLVTWLIYGRALLDSMLGRMQPRPKLSARLRTAVTKPHERMEFQRGTMASDDEGTLWIAPDPATPSNRLRAASEANVLFVVGEGPRQLPVGSVVPVIPLR